MMPDNEMTNRPISAKEERRRPISRKGDVAQAAPKGDPGDCSKEQDNESSPPYVMITYGDGVGENRREQHLERQKEIIG